MNSSSISRAHGRRPDLYCVAAGALLLSGVVGYLPCSAADVVAVRQVEAVPSPSMPAAQPVALPQSPQSATDVKVVRGRVLDFDTGLPLRRYRLWNRMGAAVGAIDGAHIVDVEVDRAHPLSATLYQLLVPAPVRDRISQGGDLLFMLDRAGAGEAA